LTKSGPRVLGRHRSRADKKGYDPLDIPGRLRLPGVGPLPGGPTLFLKSAGMARPVAHVYVDGFNLYNGLRRRAQAKGVPEVEYRWLDLVKLTRTLLPDADIARVFYFTSTVKRRIGDPGAADRRKSSSARWNGWTKSRL
jgi:hypothetical protein